MHFLTFEFVLEMKAKAGRRLNTTDCCFPSFHTDFTDLCHVGATDQSEAAQVKECVLDMTGGICRKNELVKHTQQISVQLLRPFHMKNA